MSSEIVATTGSDAGLSSFDASLAAERSAERTVTRSIVRSVAVLLPIMIAFFIGLIALAVGDDLDIGVIIGVGAMLGVIGAILFGMLAGVTLAAHAFDDVDRGVIGQH
jgi:uncharacterized membrane protein (DUF485 family)